MSGVNVWGEEDSAIGSEITAADLNGKVSKSGDTMTGDLDMTDYHITGLPTDKADVLYPHEAISQKVMVDLLTEGLETCAKTNEDLLLKLGTDTTRRLGCDDIDVGDTFHILMGDGSNIISYTAPAVGGNNPIIIDSNGLLVRFRGNDIIRFATSGANMDIIAYTKIILSTAMDCNGNVIYNLANPLGDNDAATKTYVDRKITLVGYIPPLTMASNLKLGFYVTASSYFSSTYVPYYAFSSTDNLEWCTASVTAGSWLKIQCPERVAVGKIKLRGRASNGERIYNWRFEGSNDNATWTSLYAANGVYLGSTIQYFVILDATRTTYSYYRIYVVNAEPNNPGLSIFQIYTFNQ